MCINSQLHKFKRKNSTEHNKHAQCIACAGDKYLLLLQRHVKPEFDSAGCRPSQKMACNRGSAKMLLLTALVSRIATALHVIFSTGRKISLPSQSWASDSHQLLMRDVHRSVRQTDIWSVQPARSDSSRAYGVIKNGKSGGRSKFIMRKPYSPAGGRVENLATAVMPSSTIRLHRS